jgi:hypothetical protein
MQEVLQHLYVLLPVLDDDKHYWVDEAEIDKLLRRGGDWLSAHPEKGLITRRYLRCNRRRTDAASARLLEEDVVADPDEQSEARDAEEQAVEKPISLNAQRLDAVIGAVRPRPRVPLWISAADPDSWSVASCRLWAEDSCRRWTFSSSQCRVLWVHRFEALDDPCDSCQESVGVLRAKPVLTRFEMRDLDDGPRGVESWDGNGVYLCYVNGLAP